MPVSRLSSRPDYQQRRPTNQRILIRCVCASRKVHLSTKLPEAYTSPLVAIRYCPNPNPARPMAWRHQVEFDSPTAESILRRHRMESLESVFHAGRDANPHHVGRAVWKTELLDDTGRPFTIYVKMCWGRRRLWPRLTDIVTGQVFKSLAVREWEGLDRLSQIGLRVAQRMALFEEGLFWRRSAIVVREVPPPASLSEMVCSGLWAKLSLTDRHAIFDAIARIIDRIHAAGFAWRGISSRHIYPQRLATGRWELWLIDCEGVHRARSKSDKERDLRKLERALRHDRADAATLALLRQAPRDQVIAGSLLPVAQHRAAA